MREQTVYTYIYISILTLMLINTNVQRPERYRLKTIKVKNIFTNVDVGVDGDPSKYRLSGSLLGKLTSKSRSAVYNGKLELFEDVGGEILYADRYGTEIVCFNPGSGVVKFKESDKLRLIWKGEWRRRPDTSTVTSRLVQTYFPYNGRYNAAGAAAGAGAGAGAGGSSSSSDGSRAGGAGSAGGGSAAGHAQAWTSPQAVHTTYGGGNGSGGERRSVIIDMNECGNGNGSHGMADVADDSYTKRSRGSWHGRPSQHHNPRPGAKPRYPDSNRAAGGGGGGRGGAAVGGGGGRGGGGSGGSGGRNSRAEYVLASPRFSSCMNDIGEGVSMVASPSPHRYNNTQTCLSPFTSPSPHRGGGGGGGGGGNGSGSGLDEYANGQYTVREGRGYGAYGEQRTSPFRTDNFLAPHGSGGGDGGGGGRNAPPMYVHAPGWDDESFSPQGGHNYNYNYNYNRRASLV